jgi:signal transduction histidine kinase
VTPNLVWRLTPVLVVLFSLSTSVATAHADDGVDVGAALTGTLLGGRFEVLEDASGQLGIDDVARPGAKAPRFSQTRTATPSFGYKDSTFWVRLPVENSAAVARSWLFEIAYPHFDHLTLFIPRADGSFAERRTGDMLPFSERDLAYRNFVFMLDEPAHSHAVYYLRIATSGSVSLPLRAWTLQEFIEHQYIEWALLCAFYGAVVVMGGYNACLFLFTRERAYGLFALSVLAMGLFQFSIFGHSFQFLLPNHMAVAQLMIPVSFGLFILSFCLFARWHFQEDTPDWFKRLMDVVSSIMFAATLSPFFLSYLHSVMLVWACTACLLPIALGAAVKIRLMRIPSSGPVVAGWFVLIFAGALNSLSYVGYLPSNIFTIWSLQIGGALQFVLVSAGLSNRLDGMRAKLARLNAELAGKVTELGSALTLAELATKETERATQAKDEFVATMSHELRTPLNAIINIPRGVMADFAPMPAVRCSSCKDLFELDEDDGESTRMRCPSCGQARTLEPVEHAVYVGEPARTIRHLSTIERAGQHLLGVVNAILDEGHGPSRLQIAPQHLDAAVLLQDVVDQMTPLATSSGVTLRAHTHDRQLMTRADPLRVRQVLINLIGNAIKFSDGRGEVSVLLTDRGDDCLFSVVDQGIGIAPGKQSLIFETFEQAHGREGRRFQGTGLGLYIARSLVRLHGGELWVESELGKGSKFMFSLPHALAESHPGQAPLPHARTG